MRAIRLIKVAKTIDKSMKKHVDFRNYLTCTDLGVFAVISEINLKKMGLVQPNESTYRDGTFLMARTNVSSTH